MNDFDLVWTRYAGVVDPELLALSKRYAELPDDKREAFRSRIAENQIESWRLPVVPIARRREPAPLSPLQERLWYLWKLEPDSSAYAITLNVRLEGELSPERLRSAFEGVVSRHDILRTRFEERDGEAWQVVQTDAPVAWSDDDLSRLTASEREAALSQRIRKMAMQPFDLRRSAPVRVALLRLDQGSHVFSLAMHHIIADGNSLGVLLQEVAALYEGAQLPLLPIQYGDYAAWQREWQSGPALDAQLAHWRERLGAEHPALELPTDHSRPKERAGAGGRVLRALPSALAARTHAFSRRQGVTPFMTLLAAFAVLLYRYSGQNDLRIGVPMGDRRGAETEGLIGFFVNTLVVRLELSGPMRVTDLLNQVRARAAEAQANQDTPFDRLVEALQLERRAGYSPLFQVMFSLSRSENISLPGVHATCLRSPLEMTQFDLTLDITEGPEGIEAAFEYAADLFAVETIERLCESYEQVLAGLCSDADARIEDISLPVEGCWRRGIEEGEYRDVVRRLEAGSSAGGDAIAVVCGEERVSHAGLAGWSSRVGWRLRSLGVGADDRVGLCVERSVGLVAGLIGIWKSGGAFVPLDPTYPGPRLREMIADAGVRVVVADGGSAARLAEVLSGCVVVDVGGIAEEAPAGWRERLDGRQLAYVIYTSGSTGRPKGVAISHGALSLHLDDFIATYGIGASDRVLQFATMNFDACLDQLLPALTMGGGVVMRGADIPDWDALERCLRDERITIADLPTAYWQQWLHRLPEELPWLRQVTVGGEALAGDALRRWREGPLRGIRLDNLYGPTETTVTALSHAASAADGGQITVPLGQVWPSRAAYVVDGDGNEAPVGGVGELCIGGSTVARGYLGRPGLTAERFVPDRWGAAGGRLYRTGDLCCRRADGTVEFLGRQDQQVKLRGQRIELGEVEAALRAERGVREAVAVLWGEGEGRRLVAYVSGEANGAALRSALGQRLPGFLVPSVVMVLPALPVMANGKLDRSALPAPEAAEPRALIGARSEAEAALLGVWRSVLRREDVGVTENFFEVGGDSILSLQIIARAREAGWALTPRQVFEHPTIEAAARVAEPLGQREKAEDDAPDQDWRLHLPDQALPCLRDEVQDVYRATPLQEGLAYQSQIQGDEGVYINQVLLSLRRGVNVAALSSAWEAAVARHDILRTSFAWPPGKGGVQIVRKHTKFACHVHDWTRVDDYEARLSQWRATDLGAGFDLSVAPLMRVNIFARPDGGHDLVWTNHHILLDGWSAAALTHEVLLDYRARRLGAEARLPARPPYRDYVRWISRQPSAETWWRSHLERMDDPARLADCLPRTRRPEPGSFHLKRRLSPSLASHMTQKARLWQVTLNTLLQGAWALALGRLGDRRQVLFGTTVAGRPAELEGSQDTLGLFINSLPALLDLPSSSSVADWMRAVQRQITELRQFEHTPLAQIQRYAGKGGEALFDSLVVFENYPIEEAIQNQPSGLEVQRIETADRTHFPLTLTVLPGERIEFDWEWDGSVFDSSTISGLADGYEASLGSLCGSDSMRVGEISLPVEGCWRRGVEEGEYRDVVARLEAGSSAGGEAVAVVCGEERVSHAGLAGWSSRVGWRLRSLGVGADERVGLCVERSVGLVAGLIGIWKSGGAFVPLDPTYPGPRLREMIADAGVRVVVADGGSAARLAEVLSGCVVVDVASIAEEAPAGWRERLDGRQLAYVIYTSGSTGRPKGVAISHGALSLHLDDFIATYGISASDRVLHSSTINFDVALHEILPALTMGGRVVMRGRDAWDLASLTRTLAEESVTFARIPTAYWQQWLHRLPEELPSLRQVTVGGEALAGDALRRWREGPLRGIRLDNLYGPTETTIAVLYRQTQAEDGDAVIVPIGAPYPSRAAYVVDGDGNEAPVGGVGELCIGGSTVARGYLGRPGLTAERFVPDRWGAAGGRLYRTGDLCCRRADGTVEFLGRQDQQVKLRGQRIELGEVEAALRAERGVREAVAVLWGEGEGRRLVAYVSGEANGAALRSALGQRLPGFLVPSVVMVLPALPVMANGKLDRSALPAPEAAEPRALIGARSEAEAALLGVWRSVLRREDVGVTENFFEVGGDSILSLQIIARAREAGWALTPRQVFEHPTIEAAARMAEPLGQRKKTEEAATGPLGLTPIQAEFFARRPEGSSHWNQSVLLTVRGAVDVTALERVLAALVDRHEALRLRFERDGSGAWRPSIAAEEPSEVLTAIDLRGDADWRDHLASEGTRVQRSLDLGRGPLLRALYARVGEDEGRLLLTAHHLAVDGVSWRVLLEELAEGLAQAERGGRIELPPSSTPWGIWARRLASYAKSASVGAELDWWREALAGADDSLPVKLLGERRLGDSRTVEWRLDAERTRRLLQEAGRAYRTRVDEALLAALARALGSWLGRDTVLVELEGHGREDVLPEVDLSRTVGWFTTTYPVALPVGPDVAATLIGVKERLRATPANGLSFGLLARLGDGATQAAVAALPRPQVSFNYLGQFDQSVAPEGRFGFASEASGEAMDPGSPVDSVLELNGLVAEGELSLSWRYAPEELDPAVVEGLAASFGRELEALIGHCVAAPAGATAADFPLSGLGQAELAGLELPLGGIEDLYPATPVQQGLLFHSLLMPGTGMYVNQLRLTLSGELDAEALREAWREAASRHAVLRTGFAWRHGGEPLQAVRRSVELPWEEEDWSGEDDYEAALSRWRDADVARGFDLASAPLLRLALFSRPDGGRDLIWTTHHLLLDGWSAARLLDEVAQSYRAFAAGRSARLPAPARYRDYVAWLSAQPSAETWWRKRLAALEEPATLSDALGRPAQAEPGVGRLVHRLDAAESARLQAAAQRRQVTLSTLAQGAFALLLARYSGRSEAVFGVTVAGRPAALPGVERMIGLFINSLPAWASAPASAPVSDWLRSLQAQGTELRQYEHTPLADIQTWAGRPGEPLFDALLVFENYPVEASEGLDAEGLAVSRAEMVERSHYPLTVTISPGSEIEIDWTWDGAAFTRAMMQPLLADYVSLLAQLAGDDVAVGAIGLPVTAPQPQPLAGYAFHPVAERIAARATEAPTAPAVSCGDEALDRAGLTAWSNRIAHRLLRLGVRPEERVGLCVERSAGMVAGLLGVLKAGAGYVPLDPAYPAERLRLMLDDAAVRFVVADAASAAALGDMLAGRRVIGLTEGDDEPDTAPPVTVHPDQLAYVIYTSGSTGRPKGVGVSHAALDRFLASMAERPGLAASDVWLSVTSPSFDIAALELYLPLLTGARVEIARREEITDGQRLAALLERSQATVLQATPSGWRLLLEGGWQGCRLKGLCGGEALAPDLAAALRARGVELWNMYGPTETTIWSSLACLPEGAEVSLGAAIHDTTLHLLDAVGQPAPAGGMGELCIGGANLARGYLNRPGLTAASFAPDPFGPPGARLYRTGDLCRRRIDGTVEFLGRLDQQVKLRGHRIELGEVEAALRAQPGVRDAIAVLHGPKDARRIVAYAATDRDPAALASDIAALLPAAARPALIVPLEAIPATPNGKRDRSRLPDPDAIPTQTYLPPQTQAERQLAAIWSHVLNRPQISRTDNFFNIGGDSLRALRVAALAKKVGLAWVTPGSLFAHPVLTALADQAPRADLPRSLIALNSAGATRKLFCIHPGYGLVSEYRALAQELDGVVAVIGLESPIYTEPDWRAHDLDNLARHYVASIREVQSEGPYSLLGWSHGGLVAVAMAHCLRQDGHDVEFVGLIDVAADIPVHEPAPRPDADQVELADLMREIRESRSETDGGFHAPDNAIARQAAEVIRHQDALVQGYHIPRLDVPLTVWWASRSLPRPQAQLDWTRHTSKGVRVERIIDTDHKMVVRHPELLASLRAELLTQA